MTDPPRPTTRVSDAVVRPCAAVGADGLQTAGVATSLTDQVYDNGVVLAATPAQWSSAPHYRSSWGPMMSQLLPDDAKLVQPRTTIRNKVSIKAHICDPETGVRFACHLSDVSATGCRLHCDHLPDLPDKVTLQARALSQPLEAMIVWRRVKFAGLAFTWPHAD